MSFNVEQKTITPEEAIDILERNVNNRNIRKAKVDMYAADMKAGKLEAKRKVRSSSTATADCTTANTACVACVLAAKPFDTIVVYGLAESTHSTYRHGNGEDARRRTPMDRREGHEHARIRSESACAIRQGRNVDGQG